MHVEPTLYMPCTEILLAHVATCLLAGKSVDEQAAAAFETPLTYR